MTIEHYQVLGVPRSASPGAVRAAYRALAKKWHPDANKAADGSRFRDIAAAYAVLSDARARAAYDLKLAPSPGSPGHPGAWSASDTARPEESPGVFDPQLDPEHAAWEHRTADRRSLWLAQLRTERLAQWNERLEHIEQTLTVADAAFVALTKATAALAGTLDKGPNARSVGAKEAIVQKALRDVRAADSAWWYEQFSFFGPTDPPDEARWAAQLAAAQRRIGLVQAAEAEARAVLHRAASWRPGPRKPRA